MLGVWTLGVWTCMFVSGLVFWVSVYLQDADMVRSHLPDANVGKPLQVGSEEAEEDLKRMRMKNSTNPWHQRRKVPTNI